MSTDKSRRRVAREAARLIYAREESELFRARMKAARRVHNGQVRPADLPTKREVRDQLLVLARAREAQRRREQLRQMRTEALRIMRILPAFQPRLAGGALTGDVRPDGRVQLYMFCDNADAVIAALEPQRIVCQLLPQPRHKEGFELLSPRIGIPGRFPLELTVYAAGISQEVLKSSATGRPIESASIAQLEQLLRSEHPDAPPEASMLDEKGLADRFQVYQSLLAPLENVRENLQVHPEGDMLYHSLQVFTLAREHRPYDEEFLLAALLHDVGKAIDPREHVAAGLEALQRHITPRCAWLVEHHVEALALRQGTLGARARRRLEASEDFDELMLLAACDAQGRMTGVQTPDLAEALDYLCELAETCGE